MTRNPHHLEIAAAALVRRLGGRWSPAGGMCRCPAHDDRMPSLSVRVGDYGLLFKCFAGCDAREVIAAIRRVDASALATVRRDGATIRDDNLDAWLQVRLHDLWKGAHAIRGTLGETYLRNRAVASARALRYHPRTPLGQGRDLVFRPAMLAAVIEHDRLVALQRTFLDPVSGGLARDLSPARRMLGRPGSGAVRLAPAGPVLGLAEGVETALSAMQMLGIPVWAVLGNERLPRVAVPEAVRDLVLLPDNDVAGARSAQQALGAHAGSDRTVEIVRPPLPWNDWNDLIRSKGKGTGEGVEARRGG